MDWQSVIQTADIVYPDTRRGYTYIYTFKSERRRHHP